MLGAARDANREAALLARLCGREGAGPPPRVALVVAHPDDETVGAGARLARLPDCFLVHVTDGAPRDMRDARAHGFESREAYARARRKELLAALALAGVPPERALALGWVDQEASLALAELARRLADLLDDFRPEALLTHPYEGGHPDHDATAFAAHAAGALLARAGRPVPALLEMTSYHNRRGQIAVGDFLPAAECPPITLPLDPAERALKTRMLACFQTQQATLSQFRTDAERFRRAPDYGFVEPPHPGQLFYEMFPWGMTGERFRALARAALAELELEAPRCR